MTWRSSHGSAATRCRSRRPRSSSPRRRAASERGRANRPPRTRPRADGGGHQGPGRPRHPPLRAADPQPGTAADRGAARGSSGADRGRAPHRRAGRARPAQRRAARQPVSASAERAESALQRALPLLSAGAREAAEKAGPNAPYLDLLGEDLESTGVTQDLMRTGFVPRIYERWWRPALGQVAKGLSGPSMAEEIRIARLLLGLRPGDGVLDVACGPGNFSRAFASAVGDSGLVVGIDASRTMLDRGAAELTRSPAQNLALVRGNATELPFVDDSFDAVCCFAALH